MPVNPQFYCDMHITFISGDIYIYIRRNLCMCDLYKRVFSTFSSFGFDEMKPFAEQVFLVSTNDFAGPFAV